MKKHNIVFVSVILLSLILAGIITFYETKKTPINNEDNLGILLLRDVEDTPENIRSIRDNGYTGLIVVPETMSIYGRTEDLEKHYEYIQELTSSWMD